MCSFVEDKMMVCVVNMIIDVIVYLFVVVFCCMIWIEIWGRF